MADAERTWEAQPFREEDLPALADLGREVYGSTDDETSNAAFLRWQYFDNPAGRVIAWLAKNRTSGELAGSYSVIPVRMLIAGKEATGSLSLNTMTHPNYRKQGIFKTLAEATYRSCAEGGIPLTIGLPNAQSYPGFMGGLKFGDIGHRGLLIKPFRLTNLLRRVTGNAALRHIGAAVGTIPRMVLFRRLRGTNPAHKVEEVTRFDGRFDDLWEAAKATSPNMVVRSSAYLNWRFFACPTRTYKAFAVSVNGKLAGFATATINVQGDGVTRVAFLVDALVDPASDVAAVWRSLLTAAEAWAASENADLVAVHLPPHHPANAIARRSGYWSIPPARLSGPHAFILRVHIPGTDPIATEFASWYLMDGDNDRP